MKQKISQATKINCREAFNSAKISTAKKSPYNDFMSQQKKKKRNIRKIEIKLSKARK